MSATQKPISEGDLIVKLVRLNGLKILTPQKVAAWVRERGTNRLHGLTPVQRIECAAWADNLLAQHNRRHITTHPIETDAIVAGAPEAPADASAPAVSPSPKGKPGLSREAAACYIELLTGSPDTPVCWRAIHDSNDKERAYSETAPLSVIGNALTKTNVEGGHGIFLVVNEGGHSDAQITRVRAVFIDADGIPVPEVWHVQPHFLVQRDATHWHGYWLVAPDFPLSRFEATQRRLAAFYKSDRTVCNLSRVMRVPGFLHMKNPADPQAVNQRVFLRSRPDRGFRRARRYGVLSLSIVPVVVGRPSSSASSSPRQRAPMIRRKVTWYSSPQTSSSLIAFWQIMGRRHRRRATFFD